MKRRMGAVKHSKKKANAAAWRRAGRLPGFEREPRSVTIKTEIARRYVPHSSNPAFTAYACINRAPHARVTSKKRTRCARAYGHSPTQVLKRAVASLMKTVK